MFCPTKATLCPHTPFIILCYYSRNAVPFCHSNQPKCHPFIQDLPQCLELTLPIASSLLSIPTKACLTCLMSLIQLYLYPVICISVLLSSPPKIGHSLRARTLIYPYFILLSQAVSIICTLHMLKKSRVGYCVPCSSL
jgi:hypothetical protein